jgi:hypothetical protein
MEVASRRDTPLNQVSSTLPSSPSAIDLVSSQEPLE